MARSISCDKADYTSYLWIDVDMFDHKKWKRTLHVNMLKKWSIPTLALWTEPNNATDENEDKLLSWKMTHTEELLERFSDIMSNCLEKTDLIKHEIHTTSSHPIWLHPHRTPAPMPTRTWYSKSWVICLAMVLLNHLKVRTSEWSSHIMLVKKPTVH